MKMVMYWKRDAGNGYIVSKSLLKSTKQEQEWADGDEDFITESYPHSCKKRFNNYLINFINLTAQPKQYRLNNLKTEFL